MKSPASIQLTQFNQFEITSDLCLYDSIKYTFQTSSEGGLPYFVQTDVSNLILNISTSNPGFVSSIDMQLVGSLNPYLQATYNFSVNLALFNYPNTEAPYFKGGSFVCYWIAFSFSGSSKPWSELRTAKSSW